MAPNGPSLIQAPFPIGPSRRGVATGREYLDEVLDEAPYTGPPRPSPLPLPCRPRPPAVANASRLVAPIGGAIAPG